MNIELLYNKYVNAKKKLYKGVSSVFVCYTSISLSDDSPIPVFFASLTKDTTLTYSTSILKFDDVRINVVNGYDSTTGVFTAPRNGIYQFNCLLRAKGSNDVHFQLNKNDELYTSGYVSKGHYNSQTISSVIKLMKMDRVYIKHRKGVNETVSGDNSSTFSGIHLHDEYHSFYGIHVV